MELSILIIIPVLTAVGILVSGSSHARKVALAGSFIQLIVTFALLVQYMQYRVYDKATFLFQSSHSWFPSLHINYTTGVDGISIAMIILTALVVFAGVLVSWNIDKMKK